MSRTGAALLIAATLAFVASSLGFALHMGAAAVGIPTDEAARMLAAPRLFDATPSQIDLSGLFLKPQGIGMRAVHRIARFGPRQDHRGDKTRLLHTYRHYPAPGLSLYPYTG